MGGIAQVWAEIRRDRAERFRPRRNFDETDEQGREGRVGAPREDRRDLR